MDHDAPAGGVKHAPRLPRPGPEEPGPFAFASQERVNRILDEAGFVNVAMQAHRLFLDIAAGGGLETGVEAALSVGPAARVLLDQPPEVRAAAKESVRELLAPFLKGDSIPLAGIVLDRHGAGALVCWGVPITCGSRDRGHAPP